MDTTQSTGSEQPASVEAPAAAPAVATPPAPPAATTAKLQFADQADQERYEAALQAQERLLKAPAILASNHNDPRMELRRQYAPDTIDEFGVRNGKSVPVRRAQFTAFFGDRDKTSLYANRGYLPVMNEHRRQVEHEGQLLYKRDRRISDAAEKAARDASLRRSANLHQTVRDMQSGEGGSPNAATIEEQAERREEIPQR